MKTETLTTLIGLLSLLGSVTVAVAQGTAFTYQGRLDSGGQPYTGAAEFQPTLWDAPNEGTKVADNSPPQVVVTVTNGLFVLPLDFGDSFPGSERWLQLEVRTGSGPFTTLSPRQKLTPTPYAIAASNLTGTLPASQLSGTLSSAQLGGTYSGAVTFNNPANSFTGNGAGLTGLNASQLASGTVPDARLAANMARTNQVWLLTGNAGTVPGTHFLGTTDEQPLELRVNNATTFRLLPGHNVVGGAADNSADPGVLFATIGGGTGHHIQFGAAYATVGGGIDNRIGTNAVGATIAGGAAAASAAVPPRPPLPGATIMTSAPTPPAHSLVAERRTPSRTAPPTPCWAAANETPSKPRVALPC